MMIHEAFKSFLLVVFSSPLGSDALLSFRFGAFKEDQVRR